MEPSDLSGYIKGKMEDMNLSLQNVADKLCISKQGLHNWIHRRKNINWKVESLLKLSEILNFKIVISEGKLYVEENRKMKKETNTILLNKDENIFEEVALKNENHNLEVVKRFDEYSIVKMYTPNTDVNDDIEPSLLEDWLLCYNTIEECLFVESIKSAVPVFALMDNNTLELVENITPSLYIDEIETKYLLRYAKVIEKTNDGFEVVSINKEHGIKIVKAFAEGDIYNNGFYVTRLLNHNKDKALLGLASMDINENTVETAQWFSDTRYLYADNNIKLSWQRYFDRDRNEIFEGDVIRYKGYLNYDEDDGDSFYDYNEFGKVDDFDKGKAIVVCSYSRGLCFEYNGRYHDLNELKLLKWAKV